MIKEIFPKDFKGKNYQELAGLASEIRSGILEVISQKGGHLSSSLGAVELCIALHYCLDAPSDTLIFDVGHQAYAHKLLTGRGPLFHTLREYGGISGFPNPKESVYDEYLSGHASTAVSFAQGIAEAKKINNDLSKTVALIGDGSLTGGMCFEALNHCGHSQSDVLVLFNHNEMSISRSVGALSTYLTKIVSAPVYNRMVSELDKFLKHFSFMKKLSQKAKKFEEALKGLMVPGIFFEELGFRYFGPIDGHNFEALIPTLRNVLSLKGPRLLHVVTKKGKGYPPAEKNPEDFHSASSFNIETGHLTSSSEPSYGEVFSKKLISLAETDKKIVAITAAMPKGTCLHWFAKKFPERFFDVGIAEEHAVGMASGLAKKGMKPVVAIYSTFLQRSFDQLIHDVALQNIPVTFILDRAGLVGEDGPTHHGMFDIGFMRMIPNMICMAPKDKEELEAMLEFAIETKQPASIRYPKGMAPHIKKSEKIELGKLEKLYEGKKVCLIAIGSMVSIALEMHKRLKKEGYEVGVVNARFIKPLDHEALKEMSSHYEYWITLEENSLACGFGSAVLEYLESTNLLQQVKLIREGFPDQFIPFGKRSKLFELFGMHLDLLFAKVKSIFENDTFKTLDCKFGFPEYIESERNFSN